MRAKEIAAGAHGAGFERHVEVAAGEALVVESLAGAADGEDFRMGGRIAQRARAVARGGDDAAVLARRRPRPAPRRARPPPAPPRGPRPIGSRSAGAGVVHHGARSPRLAPALCYQAPMTDSNDGRPGPPAAAAPSRRRPRRAPVRSPRRRQAVPAPVSTSRRRDAGARSPAASGDRPSEPIGGDRPSARASAQVRGEASGPARGRAPAPQRAPRSGPPRAVRSPRRRRRSPPRSASPR